MPERLLLLAVLGFAGALLPAWRTRSRRAPGVLLLLAGATVLAGLAIAVRWWQVGYGPFLTLHEVLLSNVFSLGLILTLSDAIDAGARRGMPYALPVLLLIGCWALIAPSVPARLPATFDSPWLWLHVGTGKLFLGLLLVSLGMAVAGLVEKSEAVSASLERSAWRFASQAFVFQSAHASHRRALGQSCLGALLGLGSRGDLGARDLAGARSLSARAGDLARATAPGLVAARWGFPARVPDPVRDALSEHRSSQGHRLNRAVQPLELISSPTTSSTVTRSDSAR